MKQTLKATAAIIGILAAGLLFCRNINVITNRREPQR